MRRLRTKPIVPRGRYACIRMRPGAATILVERNRRSPDFHVPGARDVRMRTSHPVTKVAPGADARHTKAVASIFSTTDTNVRKNDTPMAPSIIR